jgi:hypothetical protein
MKRRLPKLNTIRAQTRKKFDDLTQQIANTTDDRKLRQLHRNVL